MLKETKAILLIGAFLLVKNAGKINVNAVNSSAKKGKKKGNAVKHQSTLTPTSKAGPTSPVKPAPLNPTSINEEIPMGSTLVTDESMDISQALATFAPENEYSDISRAYETFSNPMPPKQSTKVVKRNTSTEDELRRKAEIEALTRKKQAEEFQRVLRERSEAMRRNNFYGST